MKWLLKFFDCNREQLNQTKKEEKIYVQVIEEIQLFEQDAILEFTDGTVEIYKLLEQMENSGYYETAGRYKFDLYGIRSGLQHSAQNHFFHTFNYNTNTPTYRDLQNVKKISFSTPVAFSTDFEVRTYEEKDV